MSGAGVQSYFQTLMSDKPRWQAVIDDAFATSPDGAWGDVLIALQDLRTTALAGGNTCYLGGKVKHEVVYWLQSKGFRVENAHVFIQ